MKIINAISIIIFTLLAQNFPALAQVPMRVGMELSYPPFEMTNERNEPSGISVEIAEALAKKLNRPLEIVNMSFDGLIPSLKTGKIDIILSSMTVSAERQQTIDFSEPYVKTGLAILAAKNSPIQSASDLDNAGLKIAVKKGTSAHLWSLKNLKKSQVLVLDKESNAILEVTQGKADAFLYDQMSVYKNWMKNHSTTRAILLPFQEEEWAIGLPKGNEVLKREINEFLMEYRRDKGFEKLAAKYFAEEKKIFESLGVGFIL